MFEAVNIFAGRGGEVRFSVLGSCVAADAGAAGGVIVLGYYAGAGAAY